MARDSDLVRREGVLVMTIADPGTALSERLKLETREAHEIAERHPLQRMLLSGTLPRTTYGSYLGQLLLVHRELDAALLRIRGARPELGLLIEEEQMQTPHLEADLDFFGVEAESIVATPSLHRIIERIREASRRNDVELLGFHYVLEGSKNGSRYIARSVRRAYGLEGIEGTRSLDPYGELQPQKWKSFKSALDALSMTPEESSRIVAAAFAMFETIGAIGTDVLEIDGVPDAGGARSPDPLLPDSI